MIKLKAVYALFFLVLVPFLKANAQTSPESEHEPNPGNTGAYAFAFIDHAGDATIGDQIIIDVKIDAGLDNLGSVQGGMLRIKIPFAHWVEIEANASADRWQISEDTRAKYGLKSTHGRFDGDLNFKTKIKILSDSKNSMRPAIAFQATVKTASGDFASTHRFTDSAGYEFSVLGSKVLMDSEDTIIRKVRLLTELAFIAWDTATAKQNDALKVSTGIQIEGNQLKMKVSFLGYYGWQDPSVDHISSLQIETSKNIKNKFQVYGQANLGLSKAATPYLLGAGVRYFIAAPKKKKKPIPIDQLTVHFK